MTSDRELCSSCSSRAHRLYVGSISAGWRPSQGPEPAVPESESVNGKGHGISHAEAGRGAWQCSSPFWQEALRAFFVEACATCSAEAPQVAPRLSAALWARPGLEALRAPRLADAGLTASGTLRSARKHGATGSACARPGFGEPLGAADPVAVQVNGARTVVVARAALLRAQGIELLEARLRPQHPAQAQPRRRAQHQLRGFS